MIVISILTTNAICNTTNVESRYKTSELGGELSYSRAMASTTQNSLHPMYVTGLLTHTGLKIAKFI